MQVFDVISGDSPVVLGQPHGGTFLPPAIAARLNENGAALADTDWHITRLYAGLLPGATVVKSNIHRYAIDANRDPEGQSLYPGQNTTSLVPLTSFDGQAIWQAGQEPSQDEIADRCAQFHTPYHAALAAELDRVRARHGVAILFDCHSIRSQIGFLFDGTLPDFNTGTNNGTTCSPLVESTVAQVASKAQGYSAVVNGRFKGGWTTRHYGRPNAQLHAVQMELGQQTYMQEAPLWGWLPERAAMLRPHLADMLLQLHRLALSSALSDEG